MSELIDDNVESNATLTVLQTVESALETTDPHLFGKNVATLYNQYLDVNSRGNNPDRQKFDEFRKSLDKGELRTIQLRARELGVHHWDDCLREMRRGLYGPFVSTFRDVQDMIYKGTRIKAAATEVSELISQAKEQ